ncbi:MAG: hypothetical protein ACLQVY_00135 [Limisphaerales bacterium]
MTQTELTAPVSVLRFDAGDSSLLMNFTSLDFEMGNPSRVSICAAGTVKV